jgi:hypothetical protein
MKYANITIKVPVIDLEIDADVDYYPEKTDEVGGYEVLVHSIEIKGCGYEVIEWEDKEIDEQSIINWQEK